MGFLFLPLLARIAGETWESDNGKEQVTLLNIISRFSGSANTMLTQECPENPGISQKPGFFLVLIKQT